MNRRRATQREVIDRLTILLRPARATMPTNRGAGGSLSLGNARGVRGCCRRLAVRAGAWPERYRLYRVCGFGFLSACFYAAMPNVR